MLGPGDPIYHPRHGFGTISRLTRLDPFNPVRDAATGEDLSDQAEDYYDILLKGGGGLLIPVARAERNGMRLLTVGVDAVAVCLRSPAESLPDDARRRAVELGARGRLGEPTALAAAVRDMLVHCRGRAHTTSEKAWLEKSCERLSTEAALVDDIPRANARTAIWEAVNQVIAA